MADEMTKAPERRETSEAPAQIGAPVSESVAAKPAEATPAQAEGEAESDSIFSEFLLFLKEEKKWWLAPLVVLLLILAALIVFSGGSVLAPLMYPFM